MGRVPDGTYDLIDETLRVVKAAAFERDVLNGLIKLLEGRAEGRLTDGEVIERVEAEAPASPRWSRGILPSRTLLAGWLC